MISVEINVRPARREELERVNELRRTVNDLHVSGRPDIFRSGFSDELQAFVYRLFDSGEGEILVAEADGWIAGFAMVRVIHRPLSPYNCERSFYGVEEIGVDERYRRRGVATALLEYMKRDAKAKGLDKIELDVWAFNGDARAFYEAAGFRELRRYLELKI